MMSYRTPKRTVPKPELIGPHQSTNPMVPESTTDLSGWRQQVYIATSVVLALGGLAALVYGPWFAITSVTVSGTRLVEPKSVQQAAERYLDRQRWLLLPNRTLWILSSRGLAKDLEQRIRARLSIEGVSIEKIRPHGLRIIVAERTPVATWSNGTTVGSIDRQGIIIETRTTPVDNVPIVRDVTGTTFTTDSSVVKPEVMQAIISLQGYLQQANIKVGEFLIPEVTCPAPVIVEPATNTNSGTNSNRTSNTNVVTYTPLQNTNVAPTTLPCDAAALRYSSQEVHVQLSDGPLALFDRHSNLEQAVQALKRVLSERLEKQPKTIDVRFGDRVYVQ